MGNLPEPVAKPSFSGGPRRNKGVPVHRENAEPRACLFSAALLAISCLGAVGCATDEDLAKVTPEVGELLSYPAGRIELRLRFHVQNEARVPPYDGGPSKWRPPGDVFLSYMTYFEAEMVASAYYPYDHPPGSEERWSVASDRAREELARFLQVIDSERTAALWQQRVEPGSAEDAVRLGVAWLHEGPVYDLYFIPMPVWYQNVPSAYEYRLSAQGVGDEEGSEQDELVISEVMAAPFWVVPESTKPPAAAVLSALNEHLAEGDSVAQAFSLICLCDVYASLERYEEAVRAAAGVAALRVSDSLKWTAVVRQAYCHLASGAPKRARKVLSEAARRLDRRACPGFMFSGAYYAVTDEIERRSRK